MSATIVLGLALPKGQTKEKISQYTSYPTSWSWVKLNKRSTLEKEVFATHNALKKMDHYLHGAQFTIKTDHKPLKYILEHYTQ